MFSDLTLFFTPNCFTFQSFGTWSVRWALAFTRSILLPSGSTLTTSERPFGGTKLTARPRNGPSSENRIQCELSLLYLCSLALSHLVLLLSCLIWFCCYRLIWFKCYHVSNGFVAIMSHLVLVLSRTIMFCYCNDT